MEMTKRINNNEIYLIQNVIPNLWNKSSSEREYLGNIDNKRFRTDIMGNIIIDDIPTIRWVFSWMKNIGPNDSA
jgi:hypothetical protein